MRHDIESISAAISSEYRRYFYSRRGRHALVNLLAYLPACLPDCLPTVGILRLVEHASCVTSY